MTRKVFPRLTQAASTAGRLVWFELQSSCNSSTVSARRCTPSLGVHHAGLSDGGELQPGSTCALAGLQHIARASLEDGQQNCPDQEGFCGQAVERPEQEPGRRVR